MKRSKFSEQQIVGVLKQAEAGVPVKECTSSVIRRHSGLLSRLV